MKLITGIDVEILKSVPDGERDELGCGNALKKKTNNTVDVSFYCENALPERNGSDSPQPPQTPEWQIATSETTNDPSPNDECVLWLHN